MPHNSSVANPPEQVSPDFLQHLAGFLLVRGRYAYFTPSADGWVGDDYPYPPREAYQGLLDRDYGEPMGLCKRDATSGWWVREWTKATVSLSCGVWQANITMK